MLLKLMLVISPALCFAGVGTVWEVPTLGEQLAPAWPGSKSEHESIFETRTIVGHGNLKPTRQIRSSKYHVLESPGLKSHFDIKFQPVDGDQPPRHFQRTVEKRSVETLDESPKQQFQDDAAPSEPKPNSEKYTQYLESNNEAVPEKPYTAREARGATKEQWIKQPYPVDFQRQKPAEEDQRTSSTDDMNVRAPRVHFVTQKRLDASETRDRPEVVQRLPASSSSQTASAPPSRAVHPYDHHHAEPSRARSLDSYDFRSRMYDGGRGRDYHDYQGRDYNRYDFDRYNPRTEYDGNYHPSSTQKKQQRIIYYATLPDVVRTPPNVDFRYRSPTPDYPEYHNRYDDRYVTSPTVAVSDNNGYYDREGRYDAPATYSHPYFNRHPYYGQYHSSKSGYDDAARLPPFGPDGHRPPSRRVHEEYRTSSVGANGGGAGGAGGGKDRVAADKERHQDQRAGSNSAPPYPVKISTAVSVKDSDRKVPERRIYADREREYVYAPPSFQTADDDSIGYDGRY